MAVTSYFKGSDSGSGFAIKAKAYDWRQDIDFTIPETPSDAIYADYPAYISGANNLEGVFAMLLTFIIHINL